MALALTRVTNSSKQRNKFIGVICLHDVSSERVHADRTPYIEMFRKAIGVDAAKNICIITTKWDLVDSTTGDQRHNELMGLNKSILDSGATMQKLIGDQSPLSIVQLIVQRHPRLPVRQTVPVFPSLNSQPKYFHPE
jgi:hypothetical protein